MRAIARGFVGAGLIVALLPLPLYAAALPAQIQGLIVGLDGRAAAGHAVHLIDATGRDVARAVVADDGAYSFGGLRAGQYAMGIEGPEGQLAPVAAPPLRVREGQLARRDVRLTAASPEQQQRALEGNYSAGMWWAGLSPGAKAGFIVGGLVVIGIILASLDDDDNESCMSPPCP